MPCLAFILSPNSPFYHHCFPSLRCRRKWICANDLPKGARTQNIIINATATATAISCMIKVPSNQCTYHAGTAVFRSTRTASPTIEFYVVHRFIYDLPILVHRYSTQNILLMQRPSQLILPSSVSWFVVLSSSS